MYEITIIVSLAIILFIFLRKWPKTRLSTSEKAGTQSELSDIDYFMEAERLFKDKNYKEAEKYYLKAVSFESDNDLIYGRLGVIYTKNNNLKDAKEALKMAVKLNPENGYYQNNLGSVLYNLERYQEALLYFENAVNIDGKIAKRWINLGLCLEKMGEKEKAKEAYKKAIELEPNNKEYQKLLNEIERD